jgi:tetratricopeptide (TPR) repeat protein
MTKLVRQWLTLLALALLPAAARAEWREYETAHFIIYSESSEKDVNRLAERLEKVDGLMRMATGIAKDVEPVKVRIYEVADADEVEKALGLSGTGIGGFYDSNILGPFAVTPRKFHFQTGRATPELVLHHEYAHHFMLQYFPAIYPAWYIEGFAELIGSSTFMSDGRIAYGMPARHRGDAISFYWVPLGDLLVKPPEKIENFDLYGQGWALTHFFTFSNTRAPQLRQFLAALMAGKPSAEAAKVFGDLGALNQEAHRYLKAGSFAYRPVAVDIARPAIQRSRVLSAGEAALIPQTIAFRDEDLAVYRKPGDRERERKLREENLARIREKVARLAGDPYALYLLAEAEYAGGNYAQAETAADRLLALQPGHVRGMVRKSILLSHAAKALEGTARTAKAAEARSLAIKANKADPNDPLPLLAYFQSFHLSGAKPSKQAVEGLFQVVSTIPNDSTFRQLLVDQLASERRWAEAIAVLTPLANSPHRSPRRDAAREQMAKLQAELAKAGGAS